MSSVRLRRTAGHSDEPVAAFAQNYGAQHQPDFVWADTVAGFARNEIPKRISDFPPLTLDLQRWPTDVPLAEARLFGPDWAVHVVADRKGCRWVAIEEQPQTDAAQDKVDKTVRQAFTLRDADRFGLAGSAWLKDWGNQGGTRIEIVEYHQNGRLLAWRLQWPKKDTP